MTNETRFSKQKLGTTGQIYKGIEREEMLNFSTSFRRDQTKQIIFETTRSITNLVDSLHSVSKVAYFLFTFFY